MNFLYIPGLYTGRIHTCHRGGRHCSNYCSDRYFLCTFIQILYQLSHGLRGFHTYIPLCKTLFKRFHLRCGCCRTNGCGNLISHIRRLIRKENFLRICRNGIMIYLLIFTVFTHILNRLRFIIYVFFQILRKFCLKIHSVKLAHINGFYTEVVVQIHLAGITLFRCLCRNLNLLLIASVIFFLLGRGQGFMEHLKFHCFYNIGTFAEP